MKEKKKLRRLPKRILAIMLTLAMVLTLMPGMSMTAYAGAPSGDCGANGDSVKWSFDGETLIISGTGAMANYAMSNNVPWDEYKDRIKKIEIGQDVTTVGSMAFEKCKNVTSIVIPERVTSIGNYAFAYCSSLTSITIPNNLTSIGYYAFAYCSSLEGITIPGGVTSIEMYTFASCLNLASITIPNKVTSIDKGAFGGCSSLASIVFEGSELPSLISGPPGSDVFSNLPTNGTITINGKAPNAEQIERLKSAGINGDDWYHKHSWEYSSSGAKLTAKSTCHTQDGCEFDNTEKTVELTLSATSPNYSGSSGSSTPVTFTKVDGSGTLSSANLGTATNWTYNETTYAVYNGFIPSSSGSSWNDARGFVAALNTAKFDGHEDWTLLSSELMATAYVEGAMPNSSNDRGDVNFLWSSVAKNESSAYVLRCVVGDWYTRDKSNANSNTGFVVLRPASSSTGDKIVTVGNDTERAAWKAALGDDSIPEVHYVGKAGSSTTLEDTTTEPTAKGRYTASISAGDPAATATVDFDIIDKHSHSFTYSANGATLTATCNHSGDLIENCDLANNKVSLTLTASSANYSGSPVTVSTNTTEATIQYDLTAWNSAGLTNPTIKYYGRENTSYTTNDTAPSAIGKYTVKIWPAGEDISSSTKYASADFEITKAAPDVSNTPAGATNLTYDGEAKSLLTTAPETSHGTLNYEITTTQTEPSSFTIANGADVKKTDAGTYYVYYKITGDDNHSDKVFDPITVTIAKKSQTVATPTASETKATKVTLNTVTGVGDTTYAKSTTSTAPTEVTAWQTSNVFSGLTKNTTYYFFAKCAGNSNTEIGISEGLSLTTPDLTDKDITGVTEKENINTTGISYGTTITKEILITGTPVLTDATNPETTYKYVGVSPTIYEESTTAPTNIGSYKMVIIMADDNYYGSKEVEFKIVKSTPAAPNATAVAPTSASATDGKITGVDTTMQYATYNTETSNYNEYQDVTGTEITGLAAGTKIKVRVKETENNNAGTDKELTVPQYTKPSSGGYRPSIPSTPSESVTVPVTGEDTVHVEANVKNGNAEVKEISTSEIDKIVENSSTEGSTTTSITIDVSAAKQDVNSVTLTKTTVDNLAQATADTSNKIDSVEIKLSKAVIILDATAIGAVNDQAKGNKVNIVLDTEKKNLLNTTQTNAVKGMNVALTFEAYVESNGSRIHDFKGGNAIVNVSMKIEADKNPKFYHVYYVSETGELEKFATRFVEGILQFTTGHFSDYIIVYDEKELNETETPAPQPETPAPQPETPAPQPETPAPQPETPAPQPETPAPQPETPAPQPETPAPQPETPAPQPETPAPLPETPQPVKPTKPTAAQKAKNTITLNAGFKVSQTGKNINVKWSKVADADGYMVYVTKCGTSFGKATKTVKANTTSVKITKLDGKKINTTKNYKVYVVAYRVIDGKKVTIGKTITAHIVGSANKKYTNVSGIKLKKTSYTLYEGRSAKINASVKLVDKTKKQLTDAHAKQFRYATTNSKIVKVSKNGRITAVGVGTCYVYVYARNGYAKKIKVTVKSVE